MKLYINDQLLSNKCTSFHISKTFLSFTNTTEGLSHELYNYDLNRRLPKPITSNRTDDEDYENSLAQGPGNVNFNVR